MYAFGVRLRYANLSNIMLGISNSLFDYCNVTITLYAYILVCFLGGGGGGGLSPPWPSLVSATGYELESF